jgi:penicillin-binding protein-related factor A (putative recombinase)
MGVYNFKEDLAESQKNRPEVIAKIKNLFVGISDIKGCDDGRYDISGVYKGRFITFEDKDDNKSYETGNVAIEWHSRGKPSGISTTIAKYWIQKICGEYYIIPTEKLKKHIENKEYFYNVVRDGGDPRSDTKMYLFKKEKFISWCVKM